MKSKILIPFLLFCLLATSVLAYTITRNSPAAYSIENSTSVVFNITPVDTGGSSSSMTCGIYNKTNRTGVYGLGTIGNITNATSGIYNLTLVDGERTWWMASCWDTPAEEEALSEVQTIPAVNTIVNLDYDANGVSAVSAFVNYSQDVTNETVTLPANDTSIGLAGNSTVTAITEFWVYNGSANVSYTSSSYSLSGGVVTLTNAAIAGNTSYWSYTFMNNSIVLPATNYNVTAGFVYMNTSTYAGDESLWNYSYPLNDYVNQTNTSIRILDVDDYYWEFINIWVPIRLVPQAAGTCDTTTNGTMFYDSGDGIFKGCTGAVWQNLSTANS